MGPKLCLGTELLQCLAYIGEAIFQIYVDIFLKICIIVLTNLTLAESANVEMRIWKVDF